MESNNTALATLQKMVTEAQNERETVRRALHDLYKLCDGHKLEMPGVLLETIHELLNDDLGTPLLHD